MKAFIAIMILLVVLVVCWFLFFYVPETSVPGDRIEVRMNDHIIIAEVAKTDEERARGLAGRTVLGADEGILFLFEALGSYGFWMKGMKIPIDIVWVSGTTVIGFEENVPPPPSSSVEDSKLAAYLPPSPIDKVLELAAGKASAMGLRVGDSLSMESLNSE